MKNTASIRAFPIILILIVLGVKSSQAQFYIETDGTSSLVRVGMNPHPAMEDDSLQAAYLLEALNNVDRLAIASARDYYSRMARLDSLKEKSYGALAYILSRHLDSEEGRKDNANGVLHILSDNLYFFFSEDNFRRLKHYLTLKYELHHYRPSSIKEFVTQRTYYDDLLMFNDPGRDQWDCTDKIFRILPITKGDKIVDMGCGFGWNSLHLAERVGSSGLVIGTDTENEYVRHVEEMIKTAGITNVKTVVTKSNEIGVTEPVDMIFISSLYHIIYTWSREDERKELMESINRCLKVGGRIAIVDNNNLHGEELNNCHVDPRLVEAQLYYYGYEKESFTKLSEQRYLLIMKKVGTHDGTFRNAPINSSAIKVSNAKSIVHIGSLDSYDITEQGINAARYVYEFLSTRQPELAHIAIRKYDELIPSENFGGEYSALQWFCEVMTAPVYTRDSMLTDPLVRDFYTTLTADSCKILRYYLMHKYKLESEEVRQRSDSILEKSGEVGRTHRSYLEDYILALNPKRPQWEHTQDILSHMAILPGDTIVDIGSGSGFFTYKFSKQTGDQGRVFALELKDEHIQSLNRFLEKEGVRNVEVIKGFEDNLNIPCKAQKMFMCSLYHILYGVTSDRIRDKYLKSVVDHLAEGGELYIVDNGPVDDATLPYHGPYISKELIITQLTVYGLKPAGFWQIIPQRYMLKFIKQ